MQLLQDMINIIHAPFAGGLDIEHLFLLVGMILVFLAAWVMILQHARAAAMEVIE